MKLALVLIHGAVVVLAALTAWLYPAAVTWAQWAGGFSLWFGGLSYFLATRKIQVAAQISGYSLNGLGLLLGLGALAGYAAGQKWCLILAALIACGGGIITVIITRFYPPEGA